MTLARASLTHRPTSPTAASSRPMPTATSSMARRTPAMLAGSLVIVTSTRPGVEVVGEVGWLEGVKAIRFVRAFGAASRLRLRGLLPGLGLGVGLLLRLLLQPLAPP